MRNPQYHQKCRLRSSSQRLEVSRFKNRNPVAFSSERGCVKAGRSVSVLESPTFEEVVEYSADAIANDGAAYRFKEPYHKIQKYHLPSVSRNGIHGGDSDILQRRKNFINKKLPTD